MAAGDSARAVALKSKERAEQLERRAQNYLTGAMGEVELHQSLQRLARLGWRALPDRRPPGGGNIDEICVGPAGVAVLDAKAWSYPVRIRDGRLISAGHRRTREVDRVLRYVRAVEDALARCNMKDVAVAGFMAFTDADHARSPERIRDVWTTGIDYLEGGFSSLPRLLGEGLVQGVTTYLESEFPQCVAD